LYRERSRWDGVGNGEGAWGGEKPGIITLVSVFAGKFRDGKDS